MIVGVGVDLINIQTFQQAIKSDRRAAARLFTHEEQVYCNAQANPAQHLTGTAAVKESVMKALSTGWTDEIDWLDIVVRRRDDGRPDVSLYGGAAALAKRLEVSKCHVSISHDGDYAVAFVVLER